MTTLQCFMDQPVNWLGRHGKLAVVPRRAERPPNFDTNFGGLEMGGCIVMVDEHRYRTVTDDAVRHAIAACGWPPPQGSLEATVKARLLTERG